MEGNKAWMKGQKMIFHPYFESWRPESPDSLLAIAYFEGQGFKITRVFPDEYVFLYKERTFEKVRVYDNGRVDGPYV